MLYQGKAVFKNKENACKNKMHMIKLHPKEIRDGSKIQKNLLGDDEIQCQFGPPPM